jgi:hypothetical protein
MSIIEFNVSPKYKKSFIEFNYLEKIVNNKNLRVIRELVWRHGEINVSIDENKLKEFNNVEELFNSIKKHNILIFDDEFPFEYEFVSSWDGCADDYEVTFVDGSEVDDKIEDEIMEVIEEDGYYELEDSHGYDMSETIYEIDGELNIKKVN